MNQTTTAAIFQITDRLAIPFLDFPEALMFNPIRLDKAVHLVQSNDSFHRQIIDEENDLESIPVTYKMKVDTDNQREKSYKLWQIKPKRNKATWQGKVSCRQSRARAHCVGITNSGGRKTKTNKRRLLLLCRSSRCTQSPQKAAPPNTYSGSCRLKDGQRSYDSCRLNARCKGRFLENQYRQRVVTPHHLQYTAWPLQISR